MRPLLALLLLLLGTANSSAQVACKPFLSIEPLREARAASPPNLPWKWKAEIIADTRYCASKSGTFEIDFVRGKENSPDLQFTQTFWWSRNPFDVGMGLTPEENVSIELMPDEAILDFRVGFIAPCPCRDMTQLSSEPVRDVPPVAKLR